MFYITTFLERFQELGVKNIDFYKNEIRAGKKNPLPWMDGRGKCRG